jgi:hypothetical protein
MMTDPTMAVPAADDETAMRRARLAAMLRGQGVPQQAYRTPGGTAMATGAQALGALGQDRQFMKWLSGQFEATPKPPAMPMDPVTGRAGGPV